MKESDSSSLQRVIHAFYENGQQDPETVIEALRAYCSKKLCVFWVDSDNKDAAEPAEKPVLNMLPERWLVAWTDRKSFEGFSITSGDSDVHKVKAADGDRALTAANRRAEDYAFPDREVRRADFRLDTLSEPENSSADARLNTLTGISLSRLLQKARKTPFCPGVLLNPGPEPVFLSMDVIDLVLKGSGSAGDPNSYFISAETGPDETGNSADLSSDESRPSDYSTELIEDLMRQGDYFHDPEGNYDIHKAYECYKKAYDLACLEKDLFLYPEISLRLAEHYPERYSHEELISLLDETILYFGIRVNAGDEAAPALLVRAQRVREQATIRQARKMVIRRYIV